MRSGNGIVRLKVRCTNYPAEMTLRTAFNGNNCRSFKIGAPALGRKRSFAATHSGGGVSLTAIHWKGVRLQSRSATGIDVQGLPRF